MYWQDKSVLITGIGGFVGGHLGRHLAGRGARVFGLTRAGSPAAGSPAAGSRPAAESITLFAGDLLDCDSLASALAESQPDVVFHLAAQSSRPQSFQDPGQTYAVNTTGTLNLLEAIRLSKRSPRFVFAGSSEEYGLVLATSRQYDAFVGRYGAVFPPPASIPELPVSEVNPLRPLSPYGVAKVQGDLMARNYHLNYDIPVVVSRAFNIEGPGRGIGFVTSHIASQAASLRPGGRGRELVIGNVNSFRDWTHIEDVVSGYALLAEGGNPGEVYVQGSQRTNSVLSYVLLSLAEVGLEARTIETIRNGKAVTNPLRVDDEPLWGCVFSRTAVDSLMLGGELSFELEDEGLRVQTDEGEVIVRFDPDRFRPLDVPVLIADTTRIKGLGFKAEHSLRDIVRGQVRFFQEQDQASPAGSTAAGGRGGPR